jgi:hypothetical protein
MDTHGDWAVIEQPAVLLIGLNVLALLSKSERLYALDTFQGDSCHRRSPDVVYPRFSSIGTAGPVSTPLSSPLETEYSSAFSELRLICRFTSTPLDELACGIWVNHDGHWRGWLTTSATIRR